MNATTKRLAAALALGCVPAFAWVDLRAQTAAPEPATVGQILEEMKRENEALLERQKTILKQMETLREDARQTRIFARRT